MRVTSGRAKSRERPKCDTRCDVRGVVIDQAGAIQPSIVNEQTIEHHAIFCNIAKVTVGRIPKRLDE